MTAADNSLNDINFENQINELGDNLPDLVKFVARQQHTASKTLVSHDKRLEKLEARDRRAFAVSGGIGGIIVAIITVVIDYLLGR